MKTPSPLWNFLLLAAPGLPASPGIAQTEEDSSFDFVQIEIVKGTEPGWESPEMRAFRQSEDYQELLAADEASARADWQAMKDKGFITASEMVVNTHVAVASSQDAVAADSIADLLAFEPVAFSLGMEVYGVLPEVAPEDGKIHDLTSLLRHPVFGNILVQERSLATEPRWRQSKYVYWPLTGMEINDHPAIYRVYKSRDGKRGRSAIMILTESRVVSLSVGIPLMRDDPRYQTFMDLAYWLAP